LVVVRIQAISFEARFLTIAPDENTTVFTSDSLWEIATGAVKAIPLMYRDRAAFELPARLLSRAERHVHLDAAAFRPLAVIDEELASVMEALGYHR